MRLRWRAVALDMDGTTLNSHHKLTQRTLDAIRRADAAGVKVVIATGRPVAALQPYIDILALPQPVPAVCFNGACAMLLGSNGAQQRLMFSEALSAGTVAQVLALCERLGLCPSYCHPLGAAAAPKSEVQERLLRSFEILEGVTQERVPNFDALIAAGTLPLKVVAMSKDPEASAAAAREALPQELVQIIAAEQHIEFLSPGVTKGHSLVKLCRETLDIAPEDVIAFGDNHNDKETLQLVGEGVAMLNAKDSVKAVAKRVCAWTNDEDGVARELVALLEESQL